MDWNQFSDDSWMEGDNSDSDHEDTTLGKPKEEFIKN